MFSADYWTQLRYEEWLAGVIKSRTQKSMDRSTWWGRHRFNLYGVWEAMNFPKDAYHYIPSDPMVVIGDFYTPGYMYLKRPQLMRLKRRYLKTLRKSIYKPNANQRLRDISR